MVSAPVWQLREDETSSRHGEPKDGSNLPAPSTKSRASAFPPTDRIRHRSDYGRILAAGSKVVGPSLVLIAVVAARPRLGLIVSKKVGGAVVRNRVKRWVREAFRQSAACPPVDLVVIARPGAATSGYHELAQGLAKGLRRLQHRLTGA